MQITSRRTNAEIAAELGRRAKQYRIRFLKPSLTQRGLAERAGIAEPTVKRLEAGGNATILTLIAVLRELGLLGNLEGVIPEGIEPSPLEVLAKATPERRRASVPRRRGRKDNVNG